MNYPILSADIETTILVAVWSESTVLQGYFKITLQDSTNKLFIYYRVVCEDYEQERFLNDEFLPEQIEFTHLYNQQEIIKQTSDDAIYLLKYPLFITISQMLKNTKQHLTYIDEIALSALIKRTTIVINNPIDRQQHDDLGFSVHMNFHAREKSSEEALSNLIQLAKLT